MRLLARLVSVVAALLVLCVSQRASAAVRAVPMCGDHNESIAAPPIFRARAAVGISAAPCELPDRLNIGSSAPLTPERNLLPERPERALGFGSLCLTRAESTRLNVSLEIEMHDLPGHAGGVFRPPRS